MRNWTEIGFSSIYFLLKKLEARGLAAPVEGATSSRRVPKTYRLTREGEQAYRDETRRTLAEPDVPFSAFPLGLANWPALPPEDAAEALMARTATLNQRLANLDGQRRRQEPLPTFVRAMFDYSAAMITAELNWLANAGDLLLETTMEKTDVKRMLKEFYSAPVGAFSLIDLPPLNYLMIDGAGDPNTAPFYKEAAEALYTASYSLKFLCKDVLKRDYVVPPLEGLWWAKDMADFISRRKDRWLWTLMILVPGFVERPLVDRAIANALHKKGLPALSKLRFEELDEGKVVQTLHVGSYDEEGPILRTMHEVFLPKNGLTYAGRHHEIYLSDPRKVPAGKLKTILRQPVKPIGKG